MRKRMPVLKKLWEYPGHLLWIFAAYLPWLGSMSVPLTGDQKVYISTAMEMSQRGSWLQPILFGEPSYYKPPFQYWVTLLSWKIFGFNLWATFLPSVLATVMTAWFLGEILILLGARREFLNVGIWFAAALGTVTYGTTAQMEIYLCLFFSAAWWAAFKYLAPAVEKRNPLWLDLAFAIAGFSAINKSPLYSVFWVVGFVTYLILSGEWELFGNARLYRAWGVGILCGLAWYIALFARDPAHFFSDYLIRETWAKNSGNDGSAISLWVALAYFSFPMTLLLIPGVRVLWTARHRARELYFFVVCWAWPPALFFTLYPYRIKPYLFLLVPMVAAVVDYSYLRSGRTIRYRRYAQVTGWLFLLGFAVFALVALRAKITPAWLTFSLLGVGAFGFLCTFKDWMRGFCFCALAALFLYRAAAIELGEQDIADLRRIAQSSPQAPLAMLDENRSIWHELGLISVALGRPVVRLYDLKQVEDFIQHGGQVALTEVQAEARLASIQADLQTFGEARKIEILPWRRWKVRAHFPYRELILKGRAGITDWDAQTQRVFRVIRFRT